MNKLHFMLPLACLLLAACGQQDAAGQRAQGSDHAASTKEDSPMTVQTANAAVARIQAPRADSVLYLISDVDGDGALSYPIANGATINFWHGQQFTSNGQQYYTGFAWLSPAVFATHEQDYPDPGQTAVLAHATFAFGGDAAQPWRWEGSELDIGHFGGYGRGNAVDSRRPVQTWPLSNGDLLLAVPTVYDTPGATMRAVDILHFSAVLPVQSDDRRWRHLGTLAAGSDNSSSCGEANPRIACRDVTGQLRIDGEAGQGFPVLSVAFPENVHEETAHYRYDAQTKTYRPT